MKYIVIINGIPSKPMTLAQLNKIRKNLPKDAEIKRV